MPQTRKPYPSDVTDEEWSLVAPYLTLMREDAVQRQHSLRELFNGLRYVTILSLRCVLPSMPMMAALSAAHLAAILFPATLRRLYIARDDDPAGHVAVARLIDRATEAGVEAIVLSPSLGDFNEDLRLLGIDAVWAAIRVQIVPEDVARFMDLAASNGTER